MARHHGSVISRLGTSVLGLCFALFGALIVWLPLSALGRRDVSYFVALVAVAVGAFVGLFGLSTAWQSARGEPTSRGFFMRWLIRASARSTPAHVLGAVVFLALIALALGASLQRPNEVEFGRDLLLGWVAFHLQILGHEYGHYFAAQGCGYRPFRIVGGAFGFSVRGNRWVAQPNRDWRFLIGGAVFASVPNHARSWNNQFWFVAAGPIASALLLYVFIKLEARAHGLPLLAEFIRINVSAGLFVLLANLAPLRIGAMGMGTDGYQLLKLFRER